MLRDFITLCISEMLMTTPLKFRVPINFEMLPPHFVSSFDWDSRLRGLDHRNVRFIMNRCSTFISLTKGIVDDEQTSSLRGVMEFVFSIYGLSQESKCKSICLITDLVDSVKSQWMERIKWVDSFLASPNLSHSLL